jgi:MFS family permease
MMTEEVMVCVNHPNRETRLRCNRCNQPICVSCAVQTPVGYRCRACIKGQQKIFETTHQIDLPVAFGVSAVAVLFVAAILSYLSFWGLFVAPVAGGVIAEIVRWFTRRRRSQRLSLIAAIGGCVGVVGYLGYLVYSNLGFYLTSSGIDLAILGGILPSLIWPVVHGVLMISAIYYRLKGIRL